MSATRKCAVWDLDNTLWDGVCLEGAVKLREPVAQAIRELDGRGILHSVASRGDEERARAVLREMDLERYFLAPRINWLPKPQNLQTIARELSLSPDAMAFIDDDPFEREQMACMQPEVMVLDARGAPSMPAMPEFTPGALTSEAASRRLYYQSELRRRQPEAGFGSREEFLRSCRMHLCVRRMLPSDMLRVLELTTRTHQLNTTGWVFTAEELADLEGRGMQVHVAELEDRWGPYGIVAAAVVEARPGLWRLRYLALSCRVMGRGIERSILARLLGEMPDPRQARVEALFRDTGRNRTMRVFYQMMGFRNAGPFGDSGITVFRAVLHEPPAAPSWVEVR